ncbi:MAG: hypothetical protein AAF485_04880 [Chloroflexota bacterium]
MTKLEALLKTTPPDLPDHPPCAFCQSEETEFMSLFGQFLLVVQYYCHNCHSAFEWCKHQGDDGEE